MAQAPMSRINQLAKDLDMKSKELLSMLEENEIKGKKTTTVLESNEFSLFLDTLTKSNQISDIDGYVHKKTSIPSVKTVEVKIKSQSRRDILLTVDGQRGYELEGGDIIRITSSNTKTKLIKLNGLDFYDTLRKKFQTEKI